MYIQIVYIIAFWATVYTDCGQCPTENIINLQDLQQAEAYNEMPKHWAAVPLDAKTSYLANTQGYGPLTCTSACEVDWLHGAYTMCNYKDPQTKIVYTLHCAKKYQDDGNRPCIKKPQYDTYWGMWCNTYYSGSVYNWGQTHYPICISTNKMCIPQRVPVVLE